MDEASRMAKMELKDLEDKRKDGKRGGGGRKRGRAGTTWTEATNTSGSGRGSREEEDLEEETGGGGRREGGGIDVDNKSVAFIVHINFSLGFIFKSMASSSSLIDR